MKTTRLVIGILSLVFCAFLFLQSCAVGIIGGMAEAEGADALSVAFTLLALGWLIGGVLSIVSRKGGKGAIVAAGFYIISAVLAVVTCDSLGGNADITAITFTVVFYSSIGVIVGGVYITGALIGRALRNSRHHDDTEF